MTAKRATGNTVLAKGVALDDFLPYLLNRIANRLNSDLAEELRGVGMTLADWRVLAVLKVRDGRSISELSVYTVIEQSTLSRIIDRMVRAGLVVRRPGDRDARRVMIFLTPRGRAAFRKALRIAFRHYEHAVAGLDEAELTRLIATLHRILENVRRSPYA